MAINPEANTIPPTKLGPSNFLLFAGVGAAVVGVFVGIDVVEGWVLVAGVFVVTFVVAVVLVVGVVTVVEFGFDVVVDGFGVVVVPFVAV